MQLTADQKIVLDAVGKFIPMKELGVRKAYARTKDEDSIEFLFTVDKRNSDDSISYIQSFISTMQKSIDTINIEVSIYIDEDKKKKDALKELVKKRDYKEASLSPSLFGALAV